MTGTANETVGQNQTVPWWIVFLEGILAAGLGILMYVHPSGTFTVFLVVLGWFLDPRGHFGPDKSNGGTACRFQMVDWSSFGIVVYTGRAVCAQPATHNRIHSQASSRVHCRFHAPGPRGYLGGLRKSMDSRPPQQVGNYNPCFALHHSRHYPVVQSLSLVLHHHDAHGRILLHFRIGYDGILRR